MGSVFEVVAVAALVKDAVAAVEVSGDVLDVAYSLAEEAAEMRAASMTACYPASSPAASEGVVLLAAGMAVGKSSLAVVDLAVRAVAAFARQLVDCRKVGSACRHSFAVALVLAGHVGAVPSWSSFAVCGLDAGQLVMMVGTSSAVVARDRAGKVASLHCASAESVEVCHASHVEMRDGAVCLSCGVRAVVCCLLGHHHLHPRHHHRRHLHPCRRSLPVPCVRVRRHSIGSDR